MTEEMTTPTGEETEVVTPAGENVEPDFDTAPEVEEPEIDSVDWDQTPDIFGEVEEEDEEEELEEEIEPETPTEELTKAEQSRYSKLKLQMEQRLQEVEQREAELAPKLEAISRWEQTAVDFEKDPVDFLKGTLGVIHGTNDPAQIDNHLIELLNEANAYLMGDAAPEEYHKRKEKRQTESEFRKLQREIQRVEQERKLEQQRGIKAQYHANASNFLSVNQEKFPALVAENESLLQQGTNAAVEIVALMEMNVAEQIRGGVPVNQVREMTFDEAAAQLETFLREDAERQLSRYNKIRAATQPDQKETTEPEGNRFRAKKGKTRSRKASRSAAPPKVTKAKGEDLDRLAVSSIWTDD